MREASHKVKFTLAFRDYSVQSREKITLYLEPGPAKRVRDCLVESDTALLVLLIPVVDSVERLNNQPICVENGKVCEYPGWGRDGIGELVIKVD